MPNYRLVYFRYPEGNKSLKVPHGYDFEASNDEEAVTHATESLEAKPVFGGITHHHDGDELVRVVKKWAIVS